jgi:A/G-specific adenine glycosylase
MPESPLHAPLLAWYAAHRRDLPWRRPGTTPWAVLVSEVMLQQTPVRRVEPAYEAWLGRWPTPTALADDSPGEAVRLWDRLGYPRRALRLHATATALRDEHAGLVPDSYQALRALPGIGDYTAAAVAAFGFGRRVAVLDTNVRRVLARVVGGAAGPAVSLSRAERDRADALLPDDEPTAATWSVAVMELGALLCTARAPRCDDCPLRERCAWRLAGHPDATGPARRPQAFAGTDRQVRGRLMAVLRLAPGAVGRADLEPVWDDAAQRERALAALVADGLVVTADGRSYALPG